MKFIVTVLLFSLVSPLLGCLFIFPLLIPIALPSFLHEVPQFMGVVFKTGGVSALIAGLIVGLVKSIPSLRGIFNPRWKSAALGGLSGLVGVLIAHPPHARWNTFALGGVDIICGLGVLAGAILSVYADYMLFKGEAVGA